jgi:hypothetical protein
MDLGFCKSGECYDQFIYCQPLNNYLEPWNKSHHFFFAEYVCDCGGTRGCVRRLGTNWTSDKWNMKKILAGEGKSK